MNIKKGFQCDWLESSVRLKPTYIDDKKEKEKTNNSKNRERNVLDGPLVSRLKQFVFLFVTTETEEETDFKHMIFSFVLAASSTVDVDQSDRSADVHDEDACGNEDSLYKWCEHLSMSTDHRATCDIHVERLVQLNNRERNWPGQTKREKRSSRPSKESHYRMIEVHQESQTELCHLPTDGRSRIRRKKISEHRLNGDW